MGKYQEQRKETELENVFEERLKPEEGVHTINGKNQKEIVWYTEQSLEGDRFKIREHLVDYEPVKADATYCLDQSAVPREGEVAQTPSKIKFIHQPKPITEGAVPEEATTPLELQAPREVQIASQTPPSTSSAVLIPAAAVHGREVLVAKQQQQQTEVTETEEILRQIEDTATLEAEHRAEKRVVFGKKSAQQPKDGVAPRFTRKILPCRVNERQRAVFECEFTGNPAPTVTWYRESYEIQNSDDFKVGVTFCFC